MNLLLISNISKVTWAGSEVVWHQAAMLALKTGHKVTAFVHPDLMPSEQIKEFKRLGGEVKNWKNLEIARFQKIKEAVVPSFPAKELNQFDSILVSLGSLPAMTYVSGLVEGLLNTRAPIVLFCQFNADHLIITPSERKIVAEVIKKSSATVFVSERNRIECRRQFATEPPNFQVIQNPTRNHSQNALPWPDEKAGYSFACVARLEVAWKGQDLLLDVLRQQEWKNRKWKMMFYGDGPDKGYLEELANFFNLSDRVSFEGHVKDLNKIWSLNHLLVLPSHGEGTPLAALEAMAAGRPIVATDVGGNSEIIHDGETGFIAEGAMLTSFSNAMERAWEYRERWQLMGRMARDASLARNAADPTVELLRVWTGASLK